MFAGLLTFFGLCAHPNRVRELHGGRLYLVCDECGDQVPALKRDAREVRQLRSGALCGTLQAVSGAPKAARESAIIIVLPSPMPTRLKQGAR